MIVYELYCIDEDRGTLYLKRDAAQADGISYIKAVGHNENWHDVDIKDAINEFINCDYADDLCCIRNRYVEE